eukprot:318044-Pyramimonas_sp.AAC.1
MSEKKDSLNQNCYKNMSCRPQEVLGECVGGPTGKTGRFDTTRPPPPRPPYSFPKAKPGRG